MLLERLLPFLFACCLAAPGAVLACGDSTTAEARPIVVMVVTNPWTMVVGADEPAFVAYADGQVIYREKDEQGAVRHMAVCLGADRLHELTDQLRALAPGVGQDEWLELSSLTDQPETRLYLDVDGRVRDTTVYGDLHPQSPEYQPLNWKADELPADVAALHDFLAQLHYPDAREWVPARLEVIVWDYHYAPDPSIHWPKRWPGIHSPGSVKHRKSYSIFLPGSERDALVAFLRTRSERGAVEIDGRKWSVSVRSVFPGAERWTSAFRRNGTVTTKAR